MNLISLLFKMAIEKKYRNFTLKYNWNCFWCGNVFLFSNTDSHVNFCIYLISWFRYAMKSTANSTKKNPATKTRRFFKTEFFFFFFVSIWQFEQKFRKLMFVALGAAFPKFQHKTCDTYDIRHVLTALLIHILHISFSFFCSLNFLLSTIFCAHCWHIFLPFTYFS